MSVVEKVRSTLGAYVDTDVRGYLHVDHERMLDLARELTVSDSAPAQKAFLAELQQLVTAHSRAEEEAVYAPLMGLKHAADARIRGHEGMIEHYLADVVLGHLVDTSTAATDVWKASARVLHELISNHIRDEEGSVFESLGEHFTEAELATMAEHFVQEKKSHATVAAHATAAIAARG